MFIPVRWVMLSGELTESSLNDIVKKNICHGGPDFQVRQFILLKELLIIIIILLLSFLHAHFILSAGLHWLFYLPKVA